jgi:hypothetical protein
MSDNKKPAENDLTKIAAQQAEIIELLKELLSIFKSPADTPGPQS